MQITGLVKSLKQTTGVSLILPLADKYPRWFLLGFFFLIIPYLKQNKKYLYFTSFCSGL